MRMRCRMQTATPVPASLTRTAKDRSAAGGWLGCFGSRGALCSSQSLKTAHLGACTLQCHCVAHDLGESILLSLPDMQALAPVINLQEINIDFDRFSGCLSLHHSGWCLRSELVPTLARGTPHLRRQIGASQALQQPSRGAGAHRLLGSHLAPQ